MVVKQVDSKGRITLDKKFAGGTMLVDMRDDGTIFMKPAVTVPAEEAWLWNNPAAIGAVQRGLAQGRRRQFVKGPNLKRAAKLAQKMGEK
jgi:hypothetical protein